MPANALDPYARIQADNPLYGGNGVTWADAADWHAQNLRDTWAAMRDPQTWRDAAQQYGNALLMGTTAPGAKLSGMKMPRLSKAEKDAIAQYASNSLWVNGPAPEAEATRKALDTAINKHQSGEGLTLYRGFGATPDITEQLQVGSVVPLSSGHVSTTRSRDVAQGFADDLYSADEKSVLVTIKTPSGTKMMKVPTAPEFQRDPDNPVDQQEMLLPRGTKFRITGRREIGDRLEITAEPDGGAAALGSQRQSEP